MASLFGHFSKQSRRSLLLRGYLTVAFLTLADYLTEREFSFLIFYFFPIITVAWFVGRKNGIVIASVAALATFAHDLLLLETYSIQNFGDLISYWTFLQRLLVFLTVSLIVSALRTSEDEKRQVEHKVARQVQSFFVPRIMPSLAHFSYTAHSKPSDHLSGDLFDCFLIGPDKLAFIVGDICGKGISAALLMAYIQGVLRSQAPISEENLAEMMATVNRSLHLSTADDKFATLFMGIYDETSKKLTYVNAGHGAPRVHRWEENGHSASSSDSAVRSNEELPLQRGAVLEVLTLERGGLLLGVDPAEHYVAHVMRLRRGDIIVCETDGVQEASNHAGEHYGHDRLTTVVSDSREESTGRIHDLILRDIQRFVGAGPQIDDMTLLVGKVF
jgi:serine phosphatase RsbU (regulator of sigma subunit)